MKFLFVGDPHNQVRTPSNRLDDFHDTFKKKVAEIKQIAKEEGVTAILQPGDFLNAPTYNTDFIMDVIKQWSFVPEKYALLEELRSGKGDALAISQRLQEDIPYIGAIGNHELVGESLKSYPRTSLAFMEQLGFMQLASVDKPIVFTDTDGTTVAITATHYHHGMDNPEHVGDYIIDEKAADVHIHMVHGYLAHKNLGDLITHTLVDAISETKADVTLAGHDHIGFSPVTIDGKVFANPGSLTRTKADVKEISRQPKVILLEIKKGKVTVEERLLKSAVRGDKVLDRTAILKRAAKASKVASIQSIVNKAKLSKGQSVTDIVSAIADAKAIDTDTTEDVVDRITEKITVMGANEVASVKPYHITQIVLENFQSHKHSVFDVSEGLNVFTGESSNGKSAVMRAMRWLMDNNGKAQRESFIMHGADFAKVSAVLSDGTMVSRIIHQQSHKENGWQIYDATTGETEVGNTRLVEKVRALFGYTKIAYDTGSDLDVNFMNQGEGWYFIGDHVKASERAKIIGAIFGTHYTDAVMRDLEKELRQVRQEARIREKDLLATTEQIETFSYLEEVADRVTKAETKLLALQALSDRRDQIVTLLANKEALDKQKETLEAILEKSKGLKQATALLATLTASNNRRILVTNLLAKRTQVVQEGRSSRQLVKQLAHLDQAKGLFETLQETAKRHTQLEALVAKEAIVRRDRDVTIHSLQRLQHLPQVSILFEGLRKGHHTHTQLTHLIQKGSEITTKARNEQANVANQNRHLEALKEEYKTLMDTYDFCPTCGQSLDEAIVNAHVAHSHA